MCGIVGYVGPRRATPILLEGLKRLEYRGYDSAGIAVGDVGVAGLAEAEEAGQGDRAAKPAQNRLQVIKKTGKIAALRGAVPKDLPGSWGIGHTRWATHGGVTDANAHPHLDAFGKIAVVHNGIIENHRSLREMLEKEGVVFASETDTEVIPNLIARYYEGDLEAAVKSALGHFQGTYGIAVIHVDHPGLIVGARNGSPLVLGIGEGEMLLASDVTAMIAHTRQVAYLNDGEVVVIDASGYRTTDREDRPVDKKVDEVTWELNNIEKGDYPCYMEKEIFEQPESIARAISGRIDRETASAKLGGLNLDRRRLREISRVHVIAAGTSWHAGLVGSALLESVARIPAGAELASELRYRNPVVEKDSLWFAVSQSGETADTLYAMREIQRKGGAVLGICNVVGSTIARESEGGVYVHSGPEIAVASTKAFTSQLAAFYLFTLQQARMRDLSMEEGLRFIEALEAVPAAVKKLLAGREAIQRVAKKYARASDFLFLGRGLMYPIALEGALKLKEISYIHAEGYASGEIKHGPIALVSGEVPSVFLVPDDGLREKTISNMREIKARGGPVIAVGVEGDSEVESLADDFLAVPKGDPRFYPFTMIVPLQLLAYFCALELGRDVDQPRNLAKSVTVE
ncbi:MAG TPA: glutamine--fructose-6-phosphate transaminase (isomerizing) [Rectinemataceae bacterium]|nr:glutamine--fructose-6-phosphate transaminase (isomerizing) [Rectinemataceae bacterium]